MDDVIIHITDPCEYDVSFSETEWTAIIAARIQGVLRISTVEQQRSPIRTHTMQVRFYNGWGIPELARLIVPIPPSRGHLDLRHGLIRTINPTQNTYHKITS